jgi:hypothetical protein
MTNGVIIIGFCLVMMAVLLFIRRLERKERICKNCEYITKNGDRFKYYCRFYRQKIFNPDDLNCSKFRKIGK